MPGEAQGLKHWGRGETGWERVVCVGRCLTLGLQEEEGGRRPVLGSRCLGPLQMAVAQNKRRRARGKEDRETEDSLL